MKHVRWIVWFSVQPGFWLSLIGTVILLVVFQYTLSGNPQWSQIPGLLLIGIGAFAGINIFCWYNINNWPQISRDRQAFEAWEPAKPSPPRKRPKKLGLIEEIDEFLRKERTEKGSEKINKRED